MATTNHQVPDWEPAVPKQSILAKVNPFGTANHAVDSKEVSVDDAMGKRGFFDRWRGGARVGRSRKMLLGMVIVIVLLAIIFGLGIGLGLSHKGKKKAQNLPLPSNTGIFTGDLTYYSPGPGYGSCGYENSSTDAICAVSHVIFDAASTSTNSNNNPLCGKKIRITRYDATVGGNRSVDVEVVDRCVGCQATDLDLSLSMFDSLAEEAQGRVVGSWAWLN